MWVVSRIGVRERENVLQLYLTHGPSGIEVSSVPATEPLIRSLGVWFSAARGSIPPLDLVRLQSVWGQYCWKSIKDLIQEYNATFPSPGTDAELLFVAALVDAHRWPAGADLLRTAANEDPSVVRRFLNQASSPPPNDAQSVARFWFCSSRCNVTLLLPPSRFPIFI